jgi:hypothetical protein
MAGFDDAGFAFALQSEALAFGVNHLRVIQQAIKRRARYCRQRRYDPISLITGRQMMDNDVSSRRALRSLRTSACALGGDQSSKRHVSLPNRILITDLLIPSGVASQRQHELMKRRHACWSSIPSALTTSAA